MCSRGVCVPGVRLKIISWSVGQRRTEAVAAFLNKLRDIIVCVCVAYTTWFPILAGVLYLKLLCVYKCVRARHCFNMVSRLLAAHIQTVTHKFLSLSLSVSPSACPSHQSHFFSSASPCCPFTFFTTSLGILYFVQCLATPSLFWLCSCWVLTIADFGTGVLFPLLLPLLSQTVPGLNPVSFNQTSMLSLLTLE